MADNYKTTPGSLHLLHPVMFENYSGDENIHIGSRITIRDNYVYIDEINTGINVKGDKGDPGESAYQIYVRHCIEAGEPYLTEEEWIEYISSNNIYATAVAKGYTGSEVEFYKSISEEDKLMQTVLTVTEE